jgi:hypothetical protein
MDGVKIKTANLDPEMLISYSFLLILDQRAPKNKVPNMSQGIRIHRFDFLRMVLNIYQNPKGKSIPYC